MERKNLEYREKGGYHLPEEELSRRRGRVYASQRNVISCVRDLSPVLLGKKDDARIYHLADGTVVIVEMLYQEFSVMNYTHAEPMGVGVALSGVFPLDGLVERLKTVAPFVNIDQV